jgi:hypothetical protein
MENSKLKGGYFFSRRSSFVETAILCKYEFAIKYS